MADIVITEFMDRTAVDALSARFDVLYDPSLCNDRSALVDSLRRARALIVRNETRVDSEILEASPLLKVVGRLGVGLDNIDVAACRDRNVEVKPATGANADAVAEYVIAAVLVLIRGAFQSTNDVISGSWPRTELNGLEVAGRTMGLVGFGDIARRVADKAVALGMSVIAHDPFVDVDDPVWGTAASVSMQELVTDSDAISLHVPLTTATEGLVDRSVIASMKPTAVLVNTSRGGIVDDAALVDALRDGRIRGAAIDVYASEPIDEVSGNVFAGVPNLILTPHIAGVTSESNARVSSMTADQVAEVLEGDIS